MIKFESQIKEIEKINPLFSRSKVYVMYTGANRNGTYISREAVEESLHTLYNIPIVGEYMEDKDNFGGHGGKIEITDDSFKFIQTTFPYGVVSSDAEVYWEKVTEDDGSVKEYLVIDGAYLWTGRYEEVENLIGQPFGQSMEINIIDGNYEIIDGDEVFNITNFAFSALCILGIDKNGEGHVEPAFESASIVAYTLDKNEFKSQFNKMIEELKFSLDQKTGNEGGETMTLEELLAKYELNADQAIEKLGVESLEEFSIEELEVKLEELFSVEEAEEVVEEESTKEVVEEDTEEVVEEFKSVEESEEQENQEGSKEFSKEEFSAEYTSALKELDELKKAYAKLEMKYFDLEGVVLNTLKADHKAKAEEIFSKEVFSNLTDEDIQDLRDNVQDYNLAELEGKCYERLGKKMATFSLNSEKPKEKGIKIGIDFEVSNDDKSYSYMFKKYLNN